MPTLRLDLDRETFEALAPQALAQRRPAVFQAEVMLRQTLGLPFSYPPAAPGGESSTPTPKRSPHG